MQVKEMILRNKFFVIVIVCAIVLMFYKKSETFRDYTSYGANPITDGYYVIRGSRNNRYCSNTANGLFCNRDLAGPDETFYVQHLGKGQYSIRSVRNDLYCANTSTGLNCTSPTVRDTEVFNLRHLGAGKYSIQSDFSGKYCSDSGHGLVCDVPDMYGWEFQMFEFIKIPYENIK